MTLREQLEKIAREAPIADANGKALWKGGTFYSAEYVVELDHKAMDARARRRERNRSRRTKGYQR